MPEDVLAHYDQLRVEDPERLRRMLSRLDGAGAPDAREGGPGNDRFRLSTRRPLAERPTVATPKNRHVRRFIRNPIGQIGQAYTREAKFGWDLVAYCLDYVEATPANAQGLAKLVSGMYGKYERQGVPEAACLAVAARGVLASCLVHRGDPEAAPSQLDSAEQPCPGCRAASLRRLSVIATEQFCRRQEPERREEAMKAASEAIELYRDAGTTDHDLLGNGLANAYMTRATALRYAGRHEAALEDLKLALDLCSPKASPRLYRQALGNTAFTLLGSGTPENLLLAVEIAAKAKKLIGRRRKPSLERAIAFWLEGQLRERLGETCQAIAALERAQEDFIGVAAASSACAVTADLIQLTCRFNHELAGDYLSELGDYRSWLPRRLCSGVSALEKLHARRADGHLLLRAAADLRQSSSNGQTLPCLI